MCLNKSYFPLCWVKSMDGKTVNAKAVPLFHKLLEMVATVQLVHVKKLHLDQALIDFFLHPFHLCRQWYSFPCHSASESLFMVRGFGVF